MVHDGPDFLPGWDIRPNLQVALLAPVCAALDAFLPARPQLADNVARHKTALLRVGHESAKAPGNLSHHRRRPRGALGLAWRRIAPPQSILEFADERRRDLRNLDLADERPDVKPDVLPVTVDRAALQAAPRARFNPQIRRLANRDAGAVRRVIPLCDRKS